MLVVAPAVIAFIMLGLAESFEVVFIAFLLLSFIFGLKDAPSVIYVSEVRWATASTDSCWMIKMKITFKFK